MNEEWTRFDETNGPTRDEYVWVTWVDGEVGYLHASSVRNADKSEILAWRYSGKPKPYTPPTPKLVPCLNCGDDKQYCHYDDLTYYTECNHCGRLVGAVTEPASTRLWNAANKPEPIPYPEMSNAFRRCVDEPLSESEMPETVFLTDIKTGQSRFQLGDYSTTADDVYKHEYRKEKTCTVKFNKSSTISGPTWTCAECGYNRILENNKHCGNCGAKIERSET